VSYVEVGIAPVQQLVAGIGLLIAHLERSGINSGLQV